MNVEIKAVRDAGNHENERIVFAVEKATEVGNYVVFDAASTGTGDVSNVLRRAYWFPDKRVSSGDLVVLYTKPGTAREKTNKNGTTSHFFYWGIEHAIWNEDDDRVVLLRIAEWAAIAANSTKA